MREQEIRNLRSCIMWPKKVLRVMNGINTSPVRLRVEKTYH